PSWRASQPACPASPAPAARASWARCTPPDARRAPSKKPFGKPKGFFVGRTIGARPRADYTENDEPQPQVVLALGLRMTNCAPS
ncbi:hypothetical protein MYD28_23955, partial [Escherichia coli]|uniref:hypothetical protein n=1 Tax=Escherichia coli TaxID=562 RepID=UPI00201EB55B